MSSTVPSNDRLVSSHWQHELRPSSTSPYDPSHHQPGQRSSRTQSSGSDRSRRPKASQIDLENSCKDVTDIELSTEYRYSLASPVSWDGAAGNVHDTSGYRLSSLRHAEPTPRPKLFIDEGYPERVRRAHLNRGDTGPPTPPMTPQISRLKTPELEPVRECSRFCGCCQNEKRYQEGRAKMDLQRRWLTCSVRVWSLGAGGREMTKQC